MEEIRLRISAEELDRMDDIIHQVMASLPDLGFRTSHSRFPYSLHHQHYRTRLRLHGKRLRHEEVSVLLNRWASKQERPTEAYIWQAIAGAILTLHGSSPIDLPQHIRSGLETVAHGTLFETWAKSFLAQVTKD